MAKKFILFIIGIILTLLVLGFFYLYVLGFFSLNTPLTITITELFTGKPIIRAFSLSGGHGDSISNEVLVYESGKVVKIHTKNYSILDETKASRMSDKKEVEITKCDRILKDRIESIIKELSDDQYQYNDQYVEGECGNYSVPGAYTTTRIEIKDNAEEYKKINSGGFCIYYEEIIDLCQN